MRLTRRETEAAIRRLGVVPAAVIGDAGDAEPLAEALRDGGLPCVEVTFRTAAAAECIRRIAAGVPEVLVGAGTVLDVTQAREARDAGASFVVAPGYDDGVVDWCLANGLAVFPGCATPTEVTRAAARGLAVVKYFPAEQLGGIPMLRALGGPFPEMGFIPTGGVSAENLGAYLRCGNVAACGGTWLARGDLLASGDFAGIERRAAEAASIVRESRP